MEHGRSAIRQLATSSSGAILAAGEFERTVHLFDLSTGNRLKTIETTLDSGGRRLAISNDGQTLIAGAYYTHGIAAYSVESGAELWRRKDLKKVQQIGFGTDDSLVWCGFDSGPCLGLCPQTGESHASLRGVRAVWSSAQASIGLLERSNGYAIAAHGVARVIARESFAALSVAFSESMICLSESGGPVRLLDATSGEEQWRHQPPKGTHFVCVEYVNQLESFVGVSLQYERGGTLSLHRFLPDGSPVLIAELGSVAEVAFASHGEKLIDADGAIYDTTDGQRVGTLDFPTA